MESNDSPEIPDSCETSDIPGLPSVGTVKEPGVKKKGKTRTMKEPDRKNNRKTRTMKESDRENNRKTRTVKEPDMKNKRRQDQ